MVDLTKYMKKELELVKPSEILAFAQYSSKIPDITKFTVGEPDFNTPEHIKEAAIAGVKANHSHYAPSNGTLGLRKAAANFLKERYGLEYNPENEVIVTNGATEAIYTALTSVLNPGDKVVVPTPIFPLYIADALLVGAEPILVDTSKNGFKLSADMLKEVLDEHGDDVRVVVLNYPSNPTGVTYSQKELDELADVIRDKPIFALCDEIYSELCYDQEHASLAKSLREQAIVLNGVSKSHAMTGYRIGIMTAPAEITKELSKIHQFTITTTTAIAQDAAQEAFENWSERHPDVEVGIDEGELHADTVAKVKGYDGVVIQQRSLVEDEVYAELKNLGLKQISTRTAGYDVINVDLAHKNGLKVTNVPAYSPRSVAELALAHTMRLIRNLELFDERAEEQDFRWIGLKGKEIHTLTIGIIGAGRIGGTAAKLFNALGAKVIAYDIKPNPELNEVLTYKSLNEVLQESDVISLHVDLNETTKGLIGSEELALMKPTAFLINECRGPVVDTDALIATLKNKKLAGAALDTLTGEENFFNFDLRGKKLPSEQLKELRAMNNVILTPHVGFYTNVAVQNMVDISLDDVLAIISEKRSDHEI